MFPVTKEHLRHVLAFEFHRKSSVEDAYRSIISAYGDGAIGLGTCQKWYFKFHNGNFDIADKPKTGRKVKFDVEKLIDIISRDSTLSLNELQKMLGASSETIRRHLQLSGWMHKYGRWIPKPTKANRQARDQARKRAQEQALQKEQIQTQIQEQEKA